MNATRTYNSDFAEHALTIDGTEVATAHKVNIMWSVKHNGRFVGMTPDESVAIATLDKIAAQYR